MELSTEILNQYRHSSEVIKEAILRGQYKAATDVNRAQLATYYGIGKYVSQNSRKGFWGTGALEAISANLHKMLPGLRGYSPQQLRFMRQFYEEWIMLDPNSLVMTSKLDSDKSLVATSEIKSVEDEIDVDLSIIISDLNAFPAEAFFKVPFTHHCRIFGLVKDIDERYYYIQRCAEEHLSVDRLKKCITAGDYEHRGEIPNNFSLTIPGPEASRKAVLQFKDEYLLNYLNIEELGERDAIDIDERVVEQQIIHNIKKFIMTFGKDFAFVGNQYHLEIYSEDFFPDLLFFNRELNALVVVELKTGKFKTGYLGQLLGYLTILDDKVRKPHENPSIGIVLCKEADKRFVEYVIKEYNKPMGVATYTTSQEMPEALRGTLPDMEELKKLL